ncbi:hypothetical protein [Paenibacillus elgii]|uniref:hypothetical protein n=1 Tax=Paenibacillus elgii TaxID=189691 RepID=UPI0020420AB9|nr:hypothetical protein [Paenibacillus elgii]MCM3267422.1 hypothetical protein [Paenibacillus elgii]
MQGTVPLAIPTAGTAVTALTLAVPVTAGAPHVAVEGVVTVNISFTSLLTVALNPTITVNLLQDGVTVATTTSSDLLAITLLGAFSLSRTIPISYFATLTPGTHTYAVTVTVSGVTLAVGGPTATITYSSLSAITAT